MIAANGGIAGMIAAQGPLGKLTARIGEDSPLGAVDTWSPTLVSTVRLMLSSKAEIVLFWGPDLCALYNEAYAPTIGDKHPRALGQPARDHWSELWDDLEPLLLSVVEQGETVHAKDRPFYIERDGGRGEEVFFDISYSPVFDADGSIGGALCIVNETTQRVRTERAMLAERTRLWTLARDPFLVADMAGRWLSVSPAWTEILGWTEAELIGRTSEWMEHPDDVGQASRLLERLRQDNAPVRFECRFRAKDGDYRIFSWTVTPDHGLLYCVARDVTEQRAHAKALAEAETALRQVQKMETLGQLTGGVAHDFNNLLQIVTGNLELLQRGLVGQERLKRAADNAMHGAERAAVLTQRLLAFSRRQPLAPARIDPNRLVSRMSDLLERTLGEMVEVETIQAAGAWAVEVDVNQMENALINLAVNARDAMPTGGKLTIEVANTHIDSHYAAQEADEVTPGQYVLIGLSDTGEGMDAETLSHAIEPFFTTKEVGRGTGLGLSMVYGFIKQSGGHIRVYSEVGQGTTIKIYLPRANGPIAANDGVVDHDDSPRGGAHETILVCEDDEKVRAYSVEVLNELGYRVIEAGDGPAALEALRRASPPVDLLFTDVVLPGGMTGADIAREAMNRQPGIKILFATGYARNAIIHHGRLDPGVELLTKPFTYADLARKVREMLDRADGARSSSL